MFRPQFSLAGNRFGGDSIPWKESWNGGDGGERPPLRVVASFDDRLYIYIYKKRNRAMRGRVDERRRVEVSREWKVG